jgi:hypothetical protein
VEGGVRGAGRGAASLACAYGRGFAIGAGAVEGGTADGRMGARCGIDEGPGSGGGANSIGSVRVSRLRGCVLAVEGGDEAVGTTVRTDEGSAPTLARNAAGATRGGRGEARDGSSSAMAASKAAIAALGAAEGTDVRPPARGRVRGTVTSPGRGPGGAVSSFATRRWRRGARGTAK